MSATDLFLLHACAYCTAADVPPPEPISNAQMKVAKVFVDALGMPIAQRMFSKVWNHREAVIDDIQEAIPTLDGDTPYIFKLMLIPPRYGCFKNNRHTSFT